MKRRILLVDDEMAILLTLKAVLEMNGFEVETAASASEAEQKLDSSTFEMVITDLNMEQPDAGYKVIHAARRQAYDPATALLTAYPEAGSEWRLHGAQSLLVKPQNAGELVRQLEALLVTHQDNKAELALSKMMKSKPRRSPAAKKTIRQAV